MRRSWLIPFLAGGSAAALLHSLLQTRPIFDSTPQDPASDYAGALQRMTALTALDTSRVKPACRSRLLTHGARAERAIVMFHGFTNCPAQFTKLAEAFFARGYNVLVPRFPQHGLESLAPDLGQLSPADLLTTARRSLDIAHGLASHVTVLGFSMGGGLAAWCGQNRADVDRVIMISPNIGLAAVPGWAARPSANLLSTLPNVFRWWDEEKKDARSGPPHVYPRFSSRGVGTMLRMNLAVLKQSLSAPPAVKELVVITNPCDDVVRNATTAELVRNWRNHGATVTTHEAPAEWQLIHDLMDPAQPEQQVDRVYPFLLERI